MCLEWSDPWGELEEAKWVGPGHLGQWGAMEEFGAEE